MLSKKAQYAFKALIYMANQPGNEPILIAEISEKKKIPLKFLENILLELKKADILDSKKGKGGGYFFKESPKNVTMAKILRLIDGPIAMLPCVSLYFYERCNNCDEQQCGLNDVMIQVRDSTLKILETRTVADIANN